MTDSQFRKNGWLNTAGWIELVYGAGECVDTLYLFFMQAHILPNFYPTMNFAEINDLLVKHPLYLAAVFTFFALGRLTAGIGVLYNRLWGFWLSLFISLVTVIWAVFMLPLAGADMLGCLIIIILLLIGRFGRQPIIQ